MKSTFTASTQYCDLKGTSSADNHDNRTMRRYLQERGHLHTNELIVGITMYSGEVHQLTQDRKVDVHVYVVRATNYEDIKALVNSRDPLPVRRINIEMHLNEFFGLFKRFEVCISNDGLIDGKEIKVLETTDVE